jgi:O-methyltransferase
MTNFFENLVQQWDSRIGYSKSDPVKRLLKVSAGFLNRGILSRFLSYSILKSEFGNLNNVLVYSERESVWDKALQIIGEGTLTYIEFGVYQGDSISYFCSRNQNRESKFLGLDSFEGLPESWAGNPIGYFTTSGVFPELKDSRVLFIKGYFNETWDELFPEISGRTNLLVHFDADLYSSTLFALTKIDILRREYYAIFDEFSGDEVRALSDYLISYGAKVEFLAVQKWRGFPEVVLCKITPLNLSSRGA